MFPAAVWGASSGGMSCYLKAAVSATDHLGNASSLGLTRRAPQAEAGGSSSGSGRRARDPPRPRLLDGVGAVVGFDTSGVTALTQKDAIGSVNLGSPEPLAEPLGE